MRTYFLGKMDTSTLNQFFQAHRGLRKVLVAIIEIHWRDTSAELKNLNL